MTEGTMTEGTESEDPVTTQNTALSLAKVKRDELFELLKHYEAAAKDERDFLFQYLNFYTGLFSVILGVTLTGLLGLSAASLNPLLKLSLLIGPLLTIVLSYAGYPMLQMCFRRFLQAWVTAINLRAMLGIAMLGFKGQINLGEGIHQPVYRGKYDKGFIAQFEVKDVPSLKVLSQEALSKAPEGSFSEEVLKKLYEDGDQLKMARIIFIAFRGAAIILSIVITLAVLFSTQSPPN
jgi:hypothetical protein